MFRVNFSIYTCCRPKGLTRSSSLQYDPVEQKLMLSSNFRCCQIHSCHIYESGHTLLCYLSPTQMFNKPASVSYCIAQGDKASKYFCDRCLRFHRRKRQCKRSLIMKYLNSSAKLGFDLFSYRLAKTIASYQVKPQRSKSIHRVRPQTSKVFFK